MIPLKDENPTTNFPHITIFLIKSNILVFVYQISQPMAPFAIFETYGLIPALLMETPVRTYPTIYSSMFLHSGLGHLAGNMLYLWIFGNVYEIFETIFMDIYIIIRNIYIFDRFE